MIKKKLYRMSVLLNTSGTFHRLALQMQSVLWHQLKLKLHASSDCHGVGLKISLDSCLRPSAWEQKTSCFQSYFQSQCTPLKCCTLYEHSRDITFCMKINSVTISFLQECRFSTYLVRVTKKVLQMPFWDLTLAHKAKKKVNTNEKITTRKPLELGSIIT